MPTYEQNVRLCFHAADDADARDVEDRTVTRLNEAGAELGCNASLDLPAEPPRRLALLPRKAVIVSMEQALAAAAGLRDGPVRLEVHDTVLDVSQGADCHTYDLAGTEVSARLHPSTPDATLVLSPEALLRQVAEGLAGNPAEVALSRPTSREQGPHAGE